MYVHLLRYKYLETSPSVYLLLLFFVESFKYHAEYISLGFY